MNFDIATILFIFALIALVSACVFTLAWYGAKLMRSIIGIWSLSQILLAAALILIPFRNDLPDFLTIVVANTGTVASQLAVQEGIFRYIGKAGYLRKVSFSILAAQFILFLLFTYLQPDVNARIIVYAVSTALVCALTLFGLFSRNVALGPPLLFFSTLLIFHMVVMGYRGAIALKQELYADFLASGFLQAVGLIGNIVYTVSLVLCFFWLISYRLRLESQQANAYLQESEAQVRLLLNSTAEAIYGIDLQGNCTFANLSCIKMLGYASQEQLLGKNMHDLIHHSYPDGQPMKNEECKIYNAFRAGKGMHVEDEVLWKADGTSFPVEYWSHPQLKHGEITGAVVTFTDISERKQAERQILHLATHDALTGLPTLRLANDRIATAIGRARRNKDRVAVMFIDLDEFKSVNDTYGHDAGDSMLRHVAEILQLSVRETDTASRVGGDEFLVVVSELHSVADAAMIAEKLIQRIAQPIQLQGEKASVGASIGISVYPDHGEEVEQLIKLADAAMYEVKKSGKNGFKFAPAKNI